MNLEVYLFQIWFTNCTNEFVWKIRPRRDSNPRLPDPLAGTHLRWVRSYLCATRSLALLQHRTLISTQTRLLSPPILGSFLFSSNHKSDVWAVIYYIYTVSSHTYTWSNRSRECVQTYVYSNSHIVFCYLDLSHQLKALCGFRNYFDILGVKVRLLDINRVREWTLKYIYSKFDLQIVLTSLCEKYHP